MASTLFPTIHGYRVNINGLDLSEGWSNAKLRDVMYSLTASPTDEALILESCTCLEADRIMNPGTMILEALTSQFEKLDRTIAKVGGLISTALSGKMKEKIDNPNGLTIDTENISLGPVRKNNLFAYRTATFDVSDGQTVSILFHSPDSDPMVMEAGETLIAYRWMLNKTDITPAVAPEGGKDITATQMATRLAKLIVTNSPKFTANANNRAETTAQLQEAENKRAELRDRANLTTAEIQKLEEDLVSIGNRISKIDESLAAARAKNERLKAEKAQPTPAPAPTPAPTTSGRRGGFGPRNQTKFEGTAELQAQFINDLKALGWQDLGDGGIGFVRNGRVVIKGYPDAEKLSSVRLQFMNGAPVDYMGYISYESENTASYADSSNKRVKQKVDDLESLLKDIIQQISEMTPDENNLIYRQKKAKIEEIESKIGKSDYASVQKTEPPKVDVYVTYDSGNDIINTRAFNPSQWEKDDKKRTYYKIETINHKGKISTKGIDNLYEINAGGTTDKTITVNGKTYGYKTGADVNSNTKREAVEEAAIKLINLIQQASNPAPAMPEPVEPPAPIEPAPLPVEPTAPAPVEPMPAPTPTPDLSGTRFASVQLPAFGSKAPDIKNIESNLTEIAKRIKQDCATLLGNAASGSKIKVAKKPNGIDITVSALPDGMALYDAPSVYSKDANAMLSALKAIGEAYIVQKNGAPNMEAINVAFDSKLTASAPTPTPTPKLYRYAMVNRPAFIGTIPKDGFVGTEPRPDIGSAHYEYARNGVAVFNRKLTDAETKQFEMSPMVGGEDMREYANIVAQKMGMYASSYLDMAEEDPKKFVGNVDSFVKSSGSGYYPSLENKSEFVDMVKGMLGDIVARQAITPTPETAPAANDAKQALIDEAQALINSKISDPKELELSLTAFEEKVDGQGLLDDLIPWLDQIANKVTKLAREKANNNGA